MSHPQQPLPVHPRLGEAVAYAAVIHAAQARKGGNIPYLAHLLQVAGLVLEQGGDPDAQLAAVLHDAGEDQGGLARLTDIRLRFGERVAALVEACSDSLAPSGAEKAPWRERKQRYLDALAVADPAALLIALCDKVHNARATLADLRTIGPSIWSRFKVGCAEQCWYLESAASLARQRGLAPALVDELLRICQALRTEGGTSMEAAK